MYLCILQNSEAYIDTRNNNQNFQNSSQIQANKKSQKASRISHFQFLYQTQNTHHLSIANFASYSARQNPSYFIIETASHSFVILFAIYWYLSRENNQITQIRKIKTITTKYLNFSLCIENKNTRVHIHHNKNKLEKSLMKNTGTDIIN